MGVLYENIMWLCAQRGIRGGKMCTDIGMSKGILTDLKMGRQSSISSANARKIADYFGVSIDYLFRDRRDPCCTPDDENPYELELRESFDTLEVDDQIYVKNWVSSFAQDPEKAKKSPLINRSKGDVLDEIDVAFYGEFKELGDDDKETIRSMVRVMRERRAKQQEK